MMLMLVLQTSLTVADEAEPSKPNFLLIMADDVGVDAIGTYGGQSYPTPHIDSLAKEGMLFHNCHVMPVCHTTRTTLLTGRYPFRNKHPKWGTFPARLESETFASALRDAGYATAVAGKWQLGTLGKDLEQPHRMGFDEYCLFGWHEGARYYDPMLYQNGQLRADTRGSFGPDEYCDFLIDFMRRKKEEPFLAYYPMAVCHDVTDDLKEPVPYGPGKNRYDTFAEMAATMDRCVGRLLKALGELELDSNTVVIFLADNGTPRSVIQEARDGKYIRKPVYSDYRGKSVRGGKGTLKNGGTHVPLIVRWPGQIEAGSLTTYLVDASDFYSTILKLADVSEPEGLYRDGRNFAHALAGDKNPFRQWIFCEHKGRSWVRVARYKKYSTGEWFDLAKDPEEKNPLQKDSPQLTIRARQGLNGAEAYLRSVRDKD